MVLRHQVGVLERQLHARVRYRPADRAMLAALSRLLPRARWRSFLVNPDTLLRWHREAAKHKWRRWRRNRGPGRPPMSDELVGLIVRLGRENRSWGCVRIQGEFRKLGVHISASSIRRVLRRHGLGPVPRGGPTGAEFFPRRPTACWPRASSPWTPCRSSSSTCCSSSGCRLGRCTSSASPDDLPMLMFRNRRITNDPSFVDTNPPALSGPLSGLPT
jgi:hypothetical protein